MDQNNIGVVKKIIRVALRPSMEKVLSNWVAQIKEVYPSFEPTSSELVAWAIESTPVLSKKDLFDIKRLYFDEVKELKVLLSDLQNAKLSGNEERVSSLLQGISFHRKNNSETEKGET